MGLSHLVGGSFGQFAVCLRTGLFCVSHES